MTTDSNQSPQRADSGDAERTILMLCYFFPPMRTTGITRSKEFARNLHELGWNPVVLSVKNAKDPWTSDFNEPIPEGLEIHRAMELNVPKAVRLLDGVREFVLKTLHRNFRVNAFHDWLCVPDHHIGWLPYLKGVALARRSRCVYASCSPFSASIMAAIIGLVAKKPVVLDFRDAWTLNPYMPHSRLHSWLAKRQERWTIGRAAKVILNTPGARTLYLEYYPEYADKFVCIPNGFDPLPEPSADTQRNDLFRIIHVGHFYGPRQPDKLLEALSEIGNENIQFVQIGKPFDSLRQYEDRVNIKIVPPLPHGEALQMMQGASLLYLKQGTMPMVRHHIATAAKTYEYLATGLPILAECPPGDNADLVAEYGANSYLITDEDPQAIKAAVLDCYAKAGDSPKQTNQAFLEGFNRAALARKFADLVSAL